MDYTELNWRVGTRSRRTIHAVIPKVVDDEHPVIGLMDTPELALATVDAHNNSLQKVVTRSQTFISYSFAEKEQLIKDLEGTLERWKITPNLEEAILQTTNTEVRARRVYQMIGLAADVLGPSAPIPNVIEHAIKLIRTN